jgi:hypothetical protein
MNMKHAIPPHQRRRSARDLELAYDLRPRDIVALYGISTSSLCHYATKLPEAQRPISHLIRGRNGRKGIRLFPKQAFAAWRACYDEMGQFDTARWATLRGQFAAEANLARPT